MSNQDQYGGKGQAGSQDNNDDWDSLTDDQRMERKQQYRDQNDQGGGQDQGDSAYSGKTDTGSRMELGDDFDSLSDEDKIARKQQYAQRDPGQYGSNDQTK